MRFSSPRRDVIVRIGPSVRFAQLNDNVMADAIWERLPHYGAAGRTAEGALALALALEVLPSALTPRTASRLTEASLSYCVATRRIVFPSAALAEAKGAFVIWAELAGPHVCNDLDDIPNGMRVSLLHADS